MTAVYIYVHMYEILFSEVIKKQQKKIPKKDLERIKVLVVALKENPRPWKCKKLVGGENEYRIRYGDWRILYSIRESSKRVVVYGILNRKEAYR